MLDFLKRDSKKNKDKNIVILDQPRPLECGGTDAYLDTSAPREITARDILLFDVTCSFTSLVEEHPEKPRIGYVSAFAAPCGEGAFVFLETDFGKLSPCMRERGWALIKKNIFPELVDLVNEEKLAAQNGYHSKTYGLPQNFGGSISVKYAGGEKISVSDNQSPVISQDTGRRIAAFFAEAMKGEKQNLPEVDTLCEIRFEDRRENGGFTKAKLVINADGTGTNIKSQRFDDPKIYESEKPVDAETVAAIKANIEKTGLFAWQNLPESEYLAGEKKKLTFVFEDGGEITVGSDRAVPEPLHGGFFNTEIEIATKH